MKRLFLVDVSSLFFRAFFAVRPLTSPAGLPTNAIYGFLSMVMKLLKDENPEYIVFCYDRKDPSFRKDIYPEYKTNRSEMPEDLAPQIPYIKKLADILGIPSLEIPKFEADDIIGTLAKSGRRHGMEVFIVSGDKDFAQLLEDHIYIYDTMKSVKIDTAGAIEKWGVPPSQFIDFLALVGDTSDNIPGVKGIGPKGAQKLLTDFGNLEGIYKNIETIKGSLKEKLIQNKDNAFLSRQLSTIVLDCIKVESEEEFRRKPFDRPALTAFLDELNFKTLEKNIWPLDVGARPLDGLARESTGLQSIADNKSAAPIIEVVANSDLPEVHEATASLDELQKIIPKNSEVWAGQGAQGFYISYDRKVYAIHGDPHDIGKVSGQMSWRWKGHDLKSLWHLTNMTKPQGSWDSMLASYIIKAGESTEFDKVYSRYAGETLPDLLSSKERLQFEVKLESKLQKLLGDIHGDSVLADLDLPLASILYRMEKKGISLDSENLKKQSQEITKDISELEKQIHQSAGESFNIASPKQLAVVMFDKLKLPPSKKTKTGFSTDTDVLEKLSGVHPVADLVLQYRELAKLKSTYIDSLPLLVKADGRIHSTFNQAHTTTGRLSSTDPNLQNIPIRTLRGAKVREAFVAAPGYDLISVDYSQIELRILAHICGDENMINAFQQDLDIHAITASEVFSVNITEVSAEQRRIAKAVNFGIAYGQGAFGLAETLRISRTESSEIIKRYFTRFPRVQNYIEDTIQSARSKGYVETLFGRRRYLDELKSKNVAIQKFGERAAINAPIQGTASDLVKKTMIELDSKINCDMLLQVHDELIFECRSEIAKQQCQIITSVMQGVADYKVPLKVNSEIGKNWGF